jgi:selenocysteine lyase/cysteine desulfurase
MSATAATAALQISATGNSTLADARTQFAIVNDEVCLNNAHWHPMSRGGMQAVQKYLDFKAHGFGKYAEYGVELQRKVRAEFAELIGTKVQEIAFVPSTMAGENTVVNGMEFPVGSNIVTDALHFNGSLYLYGELAKKRGIDLRIVRSSRADPTRIDLRDLVSRIDRRTRLVSVSLVSMINGFQHDLKAVCDAAHSSGAYVYADIIQAAGTVPIDVKKSGVDFAACASYKWLMGDMGVGFLYIREDLQDRVVKRSQYGYRQMSSQQTHVFPHDPQGANVMDWTTANGAAGLVELGTISNTTIACLSHSLPYIRSLGVENMQAHRQPMLKRLQKELPRFGFAPMTPPDSTSPIVSFARRNARELLPKLRAANVNIEVYEHRVRIAPSIYNDMTDVDRLLEALA